jgi:hypothetical protein
MQTRSMRKRFCQPFLNNAAQRTDKIYFQVIHRVGIVVVGDGMIDSNIERVALAGYPREGEEPSTPDEIVGQCESACLDLKSHKAS